jgi:hypothetical protein
MINQDRAPQPNSTANPLPTLVKGAEIRCRAASPNHGQAADMPEIFDIERALFGRSNAVFRCRQGNTEVASHGPTPSRMVAVPRAPLRGNGLMKPRLDLFAEQPQGSHHPIVRN